MSFKETIKKIGSYVYVRHIFYAICVLAVLVIAVLISLGYYTRHDAKITVPDVKGLLYESAEATLKAQGLRTMVVDSAYIRDKAPGAVIDQVPGSGQEVKPNRIIFLTVNSMSKRMVVLPNLTDISIRQAQSLIISMGLKVGSIKTVQSDFKDLVIEATCNGRTVGQGSRVADASVIHFVVGDGLAEEHLIDSLVADEEVEMGL